ncbi:hypothetical protein O5D80_002341 [Batrachochytrium dendrobatidis]|nr:hypothetical protein O5D80_002341 [Batrachochytrium dendrobatidis]
MGRSHSIDYKETNAADLVTKTDCAVEELCFKSLKAFYPDHVFIGEESTSTVTRCSFDNRPTWIIDPVDGTMNFCHGFPFTAISIGLCINTLPVLGVIYNPILDHLYYATSGTGSYLVSPSTGILCPQRLPLSPSPVPSSLATALIATEYGASKDTDILHAKIRAIQRVITTPVAGRGIRSLGSAALSMCMVAEGGVDAYYEAGIHAWDICAGIVIVREAGGVAINLGKDPKCHDSVLNEDVDVMARSILCVRGIQGNNENQVAESQMALIAQMRSLIEPIPYPLD